MGDFIIDNSSYNLRVTLDGDNGTLVFAETTACKMSPVPNGQKHAENIRKTNNRNLSIL